VPDEVHPTGAEDVTRQIDSLERAPVPPVHWPQETLS
jgi:hypothetical protein